MVSSHSPDQTPDLSLRVGRVAAPLREQVLDVVRQAILDFRYKPGQRLIERELIDQIGVSRTTIREVLRELDAEGLVATIPQRGAVVVVPSADEAMELYEVRGALEALVARLFVERADDEHVLALREAIDEFERVALTDADIRTLLQAKDRIYAALLNGASSTAIRSILGALQARVRMLRAASLSRLGRPQLAVAEMRDLLSAIEARDADAAMSACLTHIERASASGIDAVHAAVDAAT